MNTMKEFIEFLANQKSQAQIAGAELAYALGICDFNEGLFVKLHSGDESIDEWNFDTLISAVKTASTTSSPLETFVSYHDEESSLYSTFIPGVYTKIEKIYDENGMCYNILSFCCRTKE